MRKLNTYQVDLVVLAGFLVVIPPEMISQYKNRIINIHPSLIPSFCGKGYYGLKENDTPEILQRRVMEEAEWNLLPKAVELIAHNRIQVKDGKVVITEG